jgi:hypothetical protein
MKGTLLSAAMLSVVAFIAFPETAAAATCRVPLAQAEQVVTQMPGSQRLNDAVALAFLHKFNNTGPLTRYQAPVWVIDRPQDNVIEFVATENGRGCAFVAPGELRQVILKMIYGDEA